MASKRLTRSYSDRWLGGVAAGIANYFNIDPLLSRGAWALSFMLTGGTSALFYMIMWFIMPLENGHATANGFDPEEIVIEDVG